MRGTIQKNTSFKLLKTILFFSTALIFTSCGSNKFLTSEVSSNEILNLNYFESLSYIHYIEKGNKTKISDSLSKITTFKLDSILIKNSSKINLSEKITIKNDTLKARIETEISYLQQLISKQRKLDGILLTPTIDSILENSNKRFALLNVATGFGRKKGNYGGQVAKGVAVGILTLGMAIPTPIKSNFTLHTFIFDAQKNNIAFYKKSLPVEKEPTDAKTIEKQLILMFKDYFYK